MCRCTMLNCGFQGVYGAVSSVGSVAVVYPRERCAHGGFFVQALREAVTAGERQPTQRPGGLTNCGAPFSGWGAAAEQRLTWAEVLRCPSFLWVFRYSLRERGNSPLSPRVMANRAAVEGPRDALVLDEICDLFEMYSERIVLVSERS